LPIFIRHATFSNLSSLSLPFPTKKFVPSFFLLQLVPVCRQQARAEAAAAGLIHSSDFFEQLFLVEQDHHFLGAAAGLLAGWR
jgi:hypothetical protein